MRENGPGRSGGKPDFPAPANAPGHAKKVAGVVGGQEAL